LGISGWGLENGDFLKAKQALPLHFFWQKTFAQIEFFSEPYNIMRNLVKLK